MSCNYGIDVGFPRECGPDALVPGQWNDMDDIEDSKVVTWNKGGSCPEWVKCTAKRDVFTALARTSQLLNTPCTEFNEDVEHGP